jgi:drug/metabolite transporter (DMT)-like permease
MPSSSLKRNGIFLLMTGNLFFGAVPLTVKWAMAHGVSGPQSTFFRFAFAAVVVAGLLALGVQPLRTVNRKALIMRGLLGGCAVFLWFFSLEFTTAAKSTLLNYMHPFWSNLYLAMLMKQKPPRGFWPLTAMALAGLWLVLNPDFKEVNTGDLLALFSGACGGAAILFMKEARKTDNALSVFASFSFFGLLISLAYLLLRTPWTQAAVLQPDSAFYWIFSSPQAWVALAIMGLLSALGQLLMTQGYAYASVALGTLLALSVPVLASLGETIILGVRPPWTFLLGGAMILTVCAVMGLRESHHFS